MQPTPCRGDNSRFENITSVNGFQSGFKRSQYRRRQQERPLM